ncbi:MAG: acyl carrier protein [Ruminiclostridium sp.]|nr:acyl carrier protein [Ruminiclostridium sp.]MBQ9932993.1 acyl carrier protein [Ruminiclostridium sp.]
MFNKLKALIAEQLSVNPDDITLEAAFVEDLGVDSLDLVELSMALEEEFGIEEMSEEDMANIKTVGDLVEYLGKNLEV